MVQGKAALDMPRELQQARTTTVTDLFEVYIEDFRQTCLERELDALLRNGSFAVELQEESGRSEVNGDPQYP